MPVVIQSDLFGTEIACRLTILRKPLVLEILSATALESCSLPKHIQKMCANKQSRLTLRSD